VLRAVAERYGVDVENLRSLSRQARVVLARQVAMYLLRHLTDTSLPAIGKALGGKDHSTVLHAVKKIGKLVLEDAQLADDVAALMRELKKTDWGTELEFVIMVIAVSCVKLLSAHNSTQHTSRKHKV
jgi:ATPase involved in DNA replication initiation